MTKDGYYYLSKMQIEAPEKVSEMIDVAAKLLYDSIGWEPGEIYIYIDGEEYIVDSRARGSFGDYGSFEKYVIYTVPTAYAYWSSTLDDWTADPDDLENFEAKDEFIEMLAELITAEIDQKRRHAHDI